MAKSPPFSEEVEKIILEMLKNGRTYTAVHYELKNKKLFDRSYNTFYYHCTKAKIKEKVKLNAEDPHYEQLHFDYSYDKDSIKTNESDTTRSSNATKKNNTAFQTNPGKEKLLNKLKETEPLLPKEKISSHSPTLEEIQENINGYLFKYNKLIDKVDCLTKIVSQLSADNTKTQNFIKDIYRLFNDYCSEPEEKSTKDEMNLSNK